MDRNSIASAPRRHPLARPLVVVRPGSMRPLSPNSRPGQGAFGGISIHRWRRHGHDPVDFHSDRPVYLRLSDPLFCADPAPRWRWRGMESSAGVAKNVALYYTERNHQGVGGELLGGAVTVGSVGLIVKERLGGFLIKYTEVPPDSDCIPIISRRNPFLHEKHQCSPPSNSVFCVKIWRQSTGKRLGRGYGPWRG